MIQPAQAQTAAQREVLPITPKPFKGRIGKTVEESVPAFPDPIKAPRGAPNVLLVMTDDVGFAAASTFGGPIPTPNLDRLATHGLRFNNFHTTAMCSPTRAALLTGRNAHAVGTGLITETATGYPGYNGIIPESASTIAKVMKLNGYNTAMFGKHHNVLPTQTSVAGPFDAWPTGLGFEYFLGFVGSETDQFIPGLVRGTSRLFSPADRPLDELLADDAINWIHNQKAAAPNKPFFIYLAPSSNHAPLQAPKEWIRKFAGTFDAGWDVVRSQSFERQKTIGIIPSDAKLTARPDFIRAWDDLSVSERAVAARLMEIYAAALAYQDFQFGRIVDELERMGQLDNTLVIFVEGDNGASTEGGPSGTDNDVGLQTNGIKTSIPAMLARLDELGGPNSHAHYPRGWAWAMNTPFRWFKRYASHLGGIRNGAVISWPNGINRAGEVRSDFHHVVDIVPTILAAAQIPSPKSVGGVRQMPLDGFDMLLNDQKVGRTQYFELLANRAIYRDGWLASTTPPESMKNMTTSAQSTVSPLEYNWELYNLKNDFSQAVDISKEHPRILEDLKKQWWIEAQKYQVLPLDNLLTQSRIDAEIEAGNPPRTEYIYWGKGIHLDRGVAPPILRKSYRLVAELDLPENASGVIAAAGDNFGGWSFYLDAGHPIAYQAYSEEPGHKMKLFGPRKLQSGRSTLEYNVEYTNNPEGADVSIILDGVTQAHARFPSRIWMHTVTETLDIGEDSGRKVSSDSAGQVELEGQINKVTFKFGDLER